MSRQFKPVAFQPYGTRRSRLRLPRWLVLLLSGIAIGVAGVVVVQERYLPPRLSADESSKLQSAFDQADSERLRLKAELGESSKRLDAALAEIKRMTDDLAASRSTVARLRDDVASAVASLPADPRGGTVEVRAGRFTVQGGKLAYEVVLTRERETGKPLAGVMQLTVAGESTRSAETSATLEPVSLSIGTHEVARGSLALPDGFKPRQVTVQVLDRVGGRQLGMRVMLVK